MSFSITIQIKGNPEENRLHAGTENLKSDSRHVLIDQGDAVIDINVNLLQQSDNEFKTLSPLKKLKSKIKKAIQLPLFDEELKQTL